MTSFRREIKTGMLECNEVVIDVVSTFCLTFSRRTRVLSLNSITSTVWPTYNDCV